MHSTTSNLGFYAIALCVVFGVITSYERRFFQLQIGLAFVLLLRFDDAVSFYNLHNFDSRIIRKSSSYLINFLSSLIVARAVSLAILSNLHSTVISSRAR